MVLNNDYARLRRLDSVQVLRRWRENTIRLYYKYTVIPAFLVLSLEYVERQKNVSVEASLRIVLIMATE
jgi:hypothetical protein